jgi:hypothetical protein
MGVVRQVKLRDLEHLLKICYKNLYSLSKLTHLGEAVYHSLTLPRPHRKRKHVLLGQDEMNLVVVGVQSRIRHRVEPVFEEMC